MITLQNYINGSLCNPIENNWLDNIEPATGKVYSRLPDSSQYDIDIAIEAAKSAQYSWANMSVEDRSAIMMKIADGIRNRFDEFAAAESKDQGKPLWLSKAMDISRAIQNIEFFATEILHFASESHHTSQTINYTLRSPIGIVGCISPWNLPLYLFTWKIAPALATGNCVIAKPSELTPYTATLFAEICIEAGLPAGVLNILHGTGNNIGSLIVKHPDIHAISFTGGTVTGAHIASIAAPMFKKLSLELGGKNPTIIFEDANLEQAISTTVRSAFTNQGEICLCGSRILIHDSIYEQFKTEFIKQVQQLKVGDPFEADTKIGALVSEGHINKVKSYIDLAIQEGGIVLCGGNLVYPQGACEKGYFLEPTVIEGLSNTCRTNQEEIFGPVVTLQSFSDEAEAISLANGTIYGLAANIWTEHLSKAHRVSAALDFGIVWVNCWLLRDLRTPFGGVKHSGVGREGGFEVLRFFTEPKNVCIKI
ncbi:2-hydroxymuconic semialdehyde dehydrogenase [Chlorobiota bacterium]|nr:2-hydroxymuconic semialdehyde dehydrogenase [Chlorobiota bacterium]